MVWLMHTISRPDVAGLLDELFADAARADAPLGDQLRTLSPAERTALFADYRTLYGDLAKDAYLPISREGGALLYTLARARDAQTIVEFGTSFGLSTIFLAAALADRGGGRLITTELSAAKAARARANLVRVGLADAVEFRVGDALDTLADLPAGVDLLYLDGAKSLYRRVLDLVAPRFAPRAVICADNIDMAEAVGDFTSHVRDPARGYASNRLVIGGEPLEVAVRTA
jgi:predicted O-methyltransferase YrrM